MKKKICAQPNPAELTKKGNTSNITFTTLLNLIATLCYLRKKNALLLRNFFRSINARI